jgi:membrane protease YdiL (CAAX protease family)
MGSTKDLTLGTEFSTTKVYYLIFLLLVFFTYFFIYIGLNAQINISQATRSNLEILQFYMFFGLILGVLPFIVDLLIGKNKDLPLDTVSYEDSQALDILHNFWVQLGCSLVLALLMWYRISVTGQAFIKAPSFTLVSPVLASVGISNNLFGAILSGLTAGIVESIVFWGFIMPTMYAFMRSQGMGRASSVILCILLTALIFTSYHFFVYGYLITALFSVFVFGIIQGILLYTFRSQTALFITHFTNNFSVALLAAGYYALILVV